MWLTQEQHAETADELQRAPTTLSESTEARHTPGVEGSASKSRCSQSRKTPLLQQMRSGR